MRIFKSFLLTISLTILTACATSFAPQDLPTLPSEQALWFQLDKLDNQGNTLQTSLLSVQGETDGSSRWVQTDAFGVPQARLIAQTTGWQRDGFAPPNRQAQALFVKMFPLLKQGIQQEHIIQVSPEHQWRIVPIANPEGI